MLIPLKNVQEAEVVEKVTAYGLFHMANVYSLI